MNLNPKGRKQTYKFRPVVPVTSTLLPFMQSRELRRFINWHGKPIKRIGKGFKTVVRVAGLSEEIAPAASFTRWQSSSGKVLYHLGKLRGFWVTGDRALRKFARNSHSTISRWVGRRLMRISQNWGLSFQRLPICACHLRVRQTMKAVC